MTADLADAIKGTRIRQVVRRICPGACLLYRRLSGRRAARRRDELSLASLPDGNAGMPC